MSLQTAQWPDLKIKAKDSKNVKNISTEKEEGGRDHPQSHIKICSNDKESLTSNNYQLLKDEAEFDSFLEKMNEISNINKTQSLSDEDRRKNAENAILMLAKYLNLNLDDDDDECEADEEENKIN
jgi:hypothetical protein